MPASMPEHIRKLAEAQMHKAGLARVADYLLVTTDNMGGGRTPAGSSGPVALAANIQIERLDQVLAGRLLRATELRGEGFELLARDPVVHAYVREVWAYGAAPPKKMYDWDSDGRLYECLVLSRLVRDNNTACEHAVRRLVNGNGTEQLVPMAAFDSHVAYRLHPRQQGWLDISEGVRLRGLVAAYNAAGTPPRIKLAIRRLESVARERFLEDALPLAVGTAEALLKVGPAYARKMAGADYATQQFIQRVPAMAAEVGTTITQAQCKVLYRDRSALVHGGRVDLSKPHRLTAFEKGFVALVETLRAAVRGALERPAFASTFVQDAAITARWPVTVQRRDGTTTTL
jgi:hypothetical protein